MQALRDIWIHFDGVLNSFHLTRFSCNFTCVFTCNMFLNMLPFKVGKILMILNDVKDYFKLPCKPIWKVLTVNWRTKTKSKHMFIRKYVLCICDPKTTRVTRRLATAKVRSLRTFSMIKHDLTYRVLTHVYLLLVWRSSGFSVQPSTCLKELCSSSLCGSIR